jgi:hypothetical protein
MKGQVNPNIYPIIGSCIEDGLPPYIIYPQKVWPYKKGSTVSQFYLYLVSYLHNVSLCLRVDTGVKTF